MSWGEHQLIIGNPVASSQTIPEASASCAPDRILPDFNCYACILGRRFYLFVAEAKSPHSSNITYDLRKLTKAMKRMMDTLVGYGVDQPRVCGLWVQGRSYYFTMITLIFFLVNIQVSLAIHTPWILNMMTYTVWQSLIISIYRNL